MKFVLINVINLYFLINSALAQESKCYNLKLELVKETQQSAIQGEIIEHIDWRSTWHNFIRATTRGNPLRKGEISNNLCKCVLSLIQKNQTRYRNFPNVFATPININVRLQDYVFYSIPTIKCEDFVANLEYNPKIMKGNKGRAFFKNIYDIYVLIKTEGDHFQYTCYGVIRDVDMDIFKPLIEMLPL